MRRPPGLWTGQWWQLAGVTAMLGLGGAAWTGLGRPHPVAFWTAMAVPVVHQAFVWLAWRIQLRSGATGRILGFRRYLAVFFLLFGARFATLLALAWVDGKSLGLPRVPRMVVTALLLAPGMYTLDSVRRYFGMVRAAGADHFDTGYRDLPLVREGIFRFTRNGMYVFGFLPFWAIAVGFDSKAALIVAALSHGFIWTHYLATEKPDMDYLYSGRGTRTGG